MSTTINFNFKNKNNDQIKNEVLNKIMSINNQYENDSNYHDLFFNLAQNSNSKNNLKLSIQKNGSYNLKHVGGTNKLNVLGFLKSKFGGAQEDSLEELTNSNIGNLGKSMKLIGEDDENDENEEDDENEQEDNIDFDSEEESEQQSEESEQQSEQDNIQDDIQEELEQDEELSPQEKQKKFEQANNCSYTPAWFSGQKNCKLVEQNLNKNENSNAQEGGYLSDSDYESDGSIISSSTDDDFIPYTTAVFDDDDEDDMMDHIKNMKSSKYLKNLNVNELKDILKNNNQKITNNGSYLTKQELIKNIKKLYK